MALSGAVVECNDKYESGGNGCEGVGNLDAGNEKAVSGAGKTGAKGVICGELSKN